MADTPNPPDLDVEIPVPGGLKVTTDRPYHILLVSDFAGSDAGSVSGPLNDNLVAVKAENFDEVMAQASPKVNFTAKDPVGSTGAMVEVNLRFDSLKNFDPLRVAEQIPATKSLLAIREKIVARMKGDLAADAFNRAAEAAAAEAGLEWLSKSLHPAEEAPKADPDAVDSLLGQLDLGDEGDSGSSAPPPKSPLGSLISAAAGGGGLRAGESAAMRQTLTEIDRRLNAWLNFVLHHAAVQQTESAWRGLSLLVTKTDFRKGVRIDLLHAPAASLTERLVSHVIDPVFDEGATAPDFIAVDSQFASKAPDLEALDEIAQHAASLPAMAVAGISSGFFGVKQTWQISTLPPMTTLFDQWQFAKWKSLRKQAHARNLAVVFGRCLLRMPFEKPADADALKYQFAETCMTESDLVWASGAIAAACTVSRSIADTGWPTAMAGHVHGRITGLPSCYGGKTGDKRFGPADNKTPEPRIEEMAIAGINVVADLRDGEDALFWNGLTAGQPQKLDPNGLLEISLPYHLFASRLSTLLLDLKPHLTAKSSEAVCASAIGHVRNWIQAEGADGSEQVSAQVRDAEGDASSIDLALTVTAPQKILPGGIPVVLGLRLPKG
jgi:type VI secretion system protein ImpC